MIYLFSCITCSVIVLLIIVLDEWSKANIPPIPMSQVKMVEEDSICTEVCDQQTGLKAVGTN